MTAPALESLSQGDGKYTSKQPFVIVDGSKPLPCLWLEATQVKHRTVSEVWLPPGVTLPYCFMAAILYVSRKETENYSPLGACLPSFIYSLFIHSFVLYIFLRQQAGENLSHNGICELSALGPTPQQGTCIHFLTSMLSSVAKAIRTTLKPLG